MFYLNPRLVVFCLSAACGGGGGGDGEGGPGADARPDPSCDTTDLSVTWSAEVDSPHSPIAFDTDGSLLVALAQMGDEPWYCAGLARFAGDGDEIWSHPYDPSPPPAENYAPCPSWWNAVALAPNGAIVTIGDDVTGEPPGATDLVVRKHDRQGDASWTYYNQNAPDDLEGADLGADVAVDPGGFIVAVGTVGSRPWVARFAPNGEPSWLWSGSASDEDAIDVEVAADGTAFVGIQVGEEDPGYRIARFAVDGSETTIAELPTPVDLHVTADGGLVFHLPSEEPRLRKIDAEGATVWERQQRVRATDEHCHDLDMSSRGPTALGPDGSIYLFLAGGYFNTDCPEFPFDEEYALLARFSSEGELEATYFHQAWDADHLAVGPDGQVAMTSGDRVHVVTTLEGAP